MRPIHEAMQLGSQAEIDKEIKVRYALKAQMVGMLYPLILQDEIDCLMVRREELYDAC